jgi:hypothetical protein
MSHSTTNASSVTFNTLENQNKLLEQEVKKLKLENEVLKQQIMGKIYDV